MLFHSLARRRGDGSVSKCVVEVVVCDHLVHPVLHVGKLRSPLLWREDQGLFQANELSPLADGQRRVTARVFCAAAKVELYHKPS